jgi:hypothetical protein
MQLSNEIKQIISFGFFIFAILFVILLIYAMYSLFKRSVAYNITGNPVDSSQNDLPIIESKLRRFSTFNDIYMAEVKMLATPQLDNYILVVKYDWNNLGITLEKYNQDMLNEQRKLDQIKANTPTPFDQVVHILDNFESDNTGNKTKNGDLNDWRNDPYLKKVSNDTSSLFGLSQVDNVSDKTKMQNVLPQVSQADINHLFSVLDRMRMDMNLQDVIDLEVENRKMTLKLPIKVFDRNDDSVMMRFDPADLKNTFDTDILRSFDLRVFDTKVIFSPVNIPNRQVVIFLQ